MSNAWRNIAYIWQRTACQQARTESCWCSLLWVKPPAASIQVIVSYKLIDLLHQGYGFVCLSIPLQMCVVLSVLLEWIELTTLKLDSNVSSVYNVNPVKQNTC